METPLFYGDLVTTKRIIYTPSVFAKTNLLHLQEIGELTAQKPHKSKRANLSSYLFFIVVRGTGVLEYDGVHYDLKGGDCVFVDCRKPYYHETSEDLWTLKWVHFYGPNLHGIYQKYIERGGQPCFHPADLSGYERLLAMLYKIASSSSYIKDMQIYEKLAGLLTLVMEESWNPELNQRSATKKLDLQSIKEYLDQHYQEKISLDELSNLFFINKFYLTRIFKEQFGFSVNNYLTQVRITHAKQLLRFSDLSIERVGTLCGLGDANYFSRVFKKVEGMSPGEYRRHW